MIELLISIALLGLVAAFVLPKIGWIRERTAVAAMQSDLRNFAVATEMHQRTEGPYAADPLDVPGFNFSEGVNTVAYTGAIGRWSLVIGHTKSSTMCSMFIQAGQAESGKISCMDGNAIHFTVSNRAPEPGETVTFDATAGLAAFAMGGTEERAATPALRPLGVQRLHAAAQAGEGDVQFSNLTWDFGDGTRITGPVETHAVVSHTYAARGRYKVRVTALRHSGRVVGGVQDIGEGAVPSPPPPASEPEP